MSENQNIEWKESWRNEYLKWICGFANAQGGKIYIGKRDDGTVIGASNSKKLLEDILNKIQNKLGIVADVNLLTENGLEYIEIVVNPWAFPVNYDGEYHCRSGSTKQQLRGNALQSAKVPEPIATKSQNITKESEILALLREDAAKTTAEMA